MKTKDPGVPGVTLCSRLERSSRYAVERGPASLAGVPVPVHGPMREHGNGREVPSDDHVAVLLKSPAAPAYAPATPHLLTRRHPSAQLDQLPKPPQHSTRHVQRRPRRTARCVLAVLTALGTVVAVVTFLRAGGPRRGGDATARLYGDKRRSCEARGMLTPAVNGIDDAQRVVVRVTPRRSALSSEAAFVHENSIQARSFHPVLSSRAAHMFAGASETGVASAPDDQTRDDGGCLRPAVHVLDFKARPVLAAGQSPKLFFALCTSAERAIRHAQTWAHFMLNPAASSDLPPPGCVVTDAQNTRDLNGMSRADDEFRRHGLGCVMRDTSRTGQRYEARVLGLLRDAWVESELRRWRDGSTAPDWFVFGDDDTWYSDPAMLRAFLARHDPAEEHFFGAFSETRQNYEYFVRPPLPRGACVRLGPWNLTVRGVAAGSDRVRGRRDRHQPRPPGEDAGSGRRMCDPL